MFGGFFFVISHNPENKLTIFNFLLAQNTLKHYYVLK